MQNQSRAFTATTILAMLLFVPLAIVPGSALPVSDAQQGAIESHYDPLAPKGTWQHLTESAEFYFLAGSELDSPSNGASISHTLNPETGTILGTDIGPLSGAATTGTQIVLSPLDSLVVSPTADEFTRDDTRVFRLDSQMWWSGLHVQAGVQVVVELIDEAGNVLDLNGAATGNTVSFIAQPVNDFELVTVRIINTYVSEAVRYQGGHDFGFEGKVIPKGSAFRYTLTPGIDAPTSAVGGVAPGGAILHYGNADRPSRIIAQGEFAHMNAWVENVDGDVTNSMPSAFLDLANGIPAKVTDRQFVVQVVHANSWGPTQLRLPSVNANNLHSIRLIGDDGSQWLSGGTGLQTGSLHSLHTPVGDGSVEVSTHDYFYPALKNSDGDALFPDGDYQLEIFSGRQRWIYSEPSVAFDVGATGFEFELAAGEVANHVTFLGEPTAFVLEVTNTGSALETVGLSVPVGGGWAVEFSESNLQIQPGATEKITVVVTPPASGVDGSSRAFTISAAAARDRSIKTITLGVELTDVKVFGVELAASRLAVETRPGLVEEFPITLRNTGNAHDSYVVRTAGAPVGWGVSVLPTTLDVLSQSREDINLRITPPVDAEPGVGFVLDVIATRILDSGVRDTLSLPVTIFVVDGVDIQLFGGVHEIRDNGPTKYEADTFLIDAGLLGAEVFHDQDHDVTALYRVRVDNPGDRPDTFTFTWDWSAGGCRPSNNSGANSPDGWTLNIDSQFATNPAGLGVVDGTVLDYNTAAKSNTGTIGTIALDAHETKYVYFELGYTEGDVCGASGTQNALTSATNFVTARSANDPTLTSVVTLAATVPATTAFAQTPEVRDQYAGAKHDVHLQPELGQGLDGFSTENDPFALAGPAEPILQGDVPIDGGHEYQFRATNMGNERDTLRFRLSGGDPTWDYEIKIDPARGDEDTFHELSENPKQSCSKLDDRNWRCTLGAWDEVRVRVLAEPPANANIGDRDITELSVISLDNSFVQDHIEIHSRVLGDYAFNSVAPDTLLEIRPGGTASFPFTLSNLGTEADTFALTTLVGPTNWAIRFSEPSQQIFVPSGTNYRGFYTVEAPAGLLGTEADQLFRLQMESLTTGEKVIHDFFADPQPAQELSLASAGALIQSGTTGTISITANDLDGGATDVTFDLAAAALPGTWNVASTDDGNPIAFDGNDQATIVYAVAVPAGELDTSRQIVRVHATTDTGEQAEIDVVVDLASSFGVELTAPFGAAQSIVPGSSTSYTLEVRNEGLSLDTVRLESSSPTNGWTVSFSQETVSLQPLQTKEIQFTVNAPAGALVGENLNSVVFASSIRDPAQTDQLTIVTAVAEFVPEFQGLGTVKVAPDEKVTTTFTVINNGTARDTITLSSRLPAAYRDNFGVNFAPTSVSLEPGAGAEVVMTYTVPLVISQGTIVPIEVLGKSSVSPQGATGIRSFNVEVLPHEIQDIDGDLLMEVAVDRDGNAGNGLEEFRESSDAGGITLGVADLARFLTDDARAAKTTTITDSNGDEVDVFSYVIDGDEDGRVDFFLDAGADLLPDRYWDPDSRITHALTVTKDVTKDAVREYFVDVDGDGKFDRYFDITKGVFGELIQIDINSDGTIDYVVDLDGDGEVDDQEPVLIVNDDGISFVEKLDIDGDGRADSVVDIDGDGIPDYFIPFGETEGIPIVLRDIDGDGVDEWTYDADGDGKRDSFYDPVTGETGLIDSQSAFISALLEYWYVGAIFLVVAGLFVVLLIVTRR